MGMVDNYGEQPQAKSFEEMAEQEEQSVETASENSESSSEENA